MSAILLSFMLFGADPAEVKTRETPTTRLYVETTPAGATIKVDGKTEGTSPKTIIVAPGAGRLTVEVELDGHASKRQEVTIQGGRVTRLEFNFGPQVPPPKQAGSATAPPTGAETAFDKGTVLHDGFHGKFDLPWKIIRPDPSHYSLTKNPGRLTITTQRGTIHGNVLRNAISQDTLAKNIFLIPNPLPDGGKFSVTMAVSQFRPTAAYHQVGLICYNDDANYVKWSCEYNRNRGQAGATMFFLVRQTNYQFQHDVIVGPVNPGLFWMRITKHGNEYEGAYSTDGREFKAAGKLPWGDAAPKYVGFLAKNGGNPDAPDIDVCIDSFDLVLPPEAPGRTGVPPVPGERTGKIRVPPAAGSKALVMEGSMLSVVISAERDRAWGYSLKFGWDEYRAPPGVELKAVVEEGKGKVAALQPVRGNVSEIAAFSAETGKWAKHTVKGTWPPAAVMPYVSEGIVCYQLGGKAYAFSAIGKWDELETKGTVEVSDRMAWVETKGHFSVFSAHTGRWASIETEGPVHKSDATAWVEAKGRIFMYSALTGRWTSTDKGK